MNYNNIEIGKRIKMKREERGITQEELGKVLSLNKSTIQRYEAGKIEKIKLPVIQAMAQVLNVNPDWLVLKTDDPSIKNDSNIEIISTGNNIYNIPIFSSVSAGFGAYACSDIIDYMPLYFQNPSDVPDTICIKVQGDSMYPKIEDGDIIVVRRQESVDSGSIAVVLVDEEQGYVKKVIYDRETIELHSINPEYAPKVFKGKDVLRVRVVGLVKKIVKEV